MITKSIIIISLFLPPLFACSQQNEKLDRLNGELSKYEITEGKCGRIAQKLYVKNGSLIYTETSKRCNKLDSTWISVKQLTEVKSTFKEGEVSTIIINCPDGSNCVDQISFLGNRSYAKTSQIQRFEIPVRLPKREFNNLMAFIANLGY